jgi:hypothetical protein
MKLIKVMMTPFNKTILMAIAAVAIGNVELHAQSTTTSNDYTPASYLGWGDNSGDLLFKTNNTNRMVLQNTTGNFGIGVTNPTAKFHVMNSPGTAPVAFFQTNTGFPGLIVKSTGKVAVGTATGSQAQFDVRGEGLPSTYENLFFFSVSDVTTDAGGSVKDYVAITNASNTDGQFAPLIASAYGSGASAPNLNFRAQTPLANDVGDTPMSRFDAYLLGTSNLVAIRPLVQFSNRGNIRVSIAANGSIYSGSLPNGSFNNTPQAQLHVICSGTTPTSFTAKFQNSTSADIFTIRNDNKIIYTDGTQGAGKVLTSDANGVASWQAIVAGGSSQWTTTGDHIYYTTGNVGIGTTTPDTKLHVAGAVKIVDGTQAAGKILTSDANGLASWQLAGISSQWTTAGNNIHYTAGNIGIGTTTPDTKLHVAGAIKIVDGTQGAGKVLTSDVNGAASWQPAAIGSQWTTNGTTIYYGSGKVLIGDPNLAGFKGTPGTYQLYVQGGILTEKVKAAVATTNDWSDYVFAKDYQLKSLKEVELFVKSNKHLPNVPSAAEVVKEGIDMAKMDATLLEKIEELTLYLIELDKKNADQQKQIVELSNTVKALQNK